MRAGYLWRSLPLTIFSATALLLAGCLATPSYVITLHDGRVYRAAQPPVLNARTGYYKFRDRYGRDVLLRNNEVSAIEKDPVGESPKDAPAAVKKGRQA